MPNYFQIPSCTAKLWPGHDSGIHKHTGQTLYALPPFYGGVIKNGGFLKNYFWRHIINLNQTDVMKWHFKCVSKTWNCFENEISPSFIEETFQKLHGPSMFAVNEKLYGSSIAFDETSSYWSAPKSS